MSRIAKILLSACLMTAVAWSLSLGAPKAQAAGCTGGSQICETVEVCVGVFVKLCSTKYWYQRPKAT